MIFHISRCHFIICLSVYIFFLSHLFITFVFNLYFWFLQVLRLDTSFFSSLNSVLLLHMQNQIVRPMSSGFSAVLLERSKNSFALIYAKVSNAKQDTRRVSSNLKSQGINKSSRGATEKTKTCHIERNHFWNLATNIVFEQFMDKLTHSTKPYQITSLRGWRHWRGTYQSPSSQRKRVANLIK